MEGVGVVINSQSNTRQVVEPLPAGDDRICDNCAKRQATVNWVGSGGELAYEKGLYNRWCEHCAVSAQIVYEEGKVGVLDKLRVRLAELEAVEQ